MPGHSHDDETFGPSHGPVKGTTDHKLSLDANTVTLSGFTFRGFATARVEGSLRDYIPPPPFGVRSGDFAPSSTQGSALRRLRHLPAGVVGLSFFRLRLQKDVGIDFVDYIPTPCLGARGCVSG